MIAIGGILSSIVLVSMNDARGAARDAARQADMRMMATAQEIYYGENGAYYTSASYPSRIGSYMAETPTDPKTEVSYGWINNTGNSQGFCAYADLEKGGFFVATRGGNGEITIEPYTLSDCENFPGFWSY